MDVSHMEDMMRLFRKRNKCKNVCSFYKVTETVSSEGVVNQYLCDNCDTYLTPGGTIGTRRNRLCKCCGLSVKYIEKLFDDEDLIDHELEEIKKSSPIISENKSNRKTYGELIEFIDAGMHSQANYQLVMLKYLVNHKIADKAEISEDLAYHNNKNVNDIDQVKKFYDIPVFEVLEKKGFTTKSDHSGKYDYYLNVDLNEFQTISVNELLERKIKEYNLEHYIPENESDSLVLNMEQKNNLKNDSDFLQTQVHPYENIKESLEEPEIPKNLDEQSRIFVDNVPDGLMIKEFKEIKSEILQKDQIVSNDQLMEKFGVGNMGGIRYSKRNNILILCSSLSSHYSNTIDQDSGLIKYTGEGRVGNQTLTKGNYRIVNSENIPILFFKEKPQDPGNKKRGALDNLYIFVGKVKYLKHYFTNESDKLGNQRQVIKFILEVE